eukprot:g9600.t1
MSASTSHASQLGLAALSRQLAEQQGCLLALTGKLQGVQDSTRRLNEFELQEAKVWQSRLAEAEEKAAEHFAKDREEHGFKEAIHRAQQRVQMMKEVSSSHLYREWQRLFFAHHRHAMELERQLKECEERTSTAAAKARLWRHSAKQMYQEVQPCEVRHGVLEDTIAMMLMLQSTDITALHCSEATQAGRMGQEHQSQALALLRHSALIRADEQNAQQELHGLWSELAETHREAAQQTAALRRTTELREAVEKDVLGLRETTACLGQQRWRTQQELHYAEGVAASPRLKAKLSGGALVPALQLPEGYAGSTPTQVPCPLFVEGAALGRS